MTNAVKIQRNIAFLAIALFLIKLVAWYWTHSVAVFTDAMESIVNIAAGLFSWYSVWLSSKPRDRNHPYGHGKVEFISASIEGALIIIAGLAIAYQAISSIANPPQIQKLDFGLALLAFTAIVNYLAGFFAVKRGVKTDSMALEAAGKHLKTDTYSTIGIIVGLLLIKVTGWQFLDIVIALLMSILILKTGYQVLRRSMAGIMDEADLKQLEKLIAFLEKNRHPAWIDIHNLRMVRYGQVMHFDGHITLPWYYTVLQAHDEIEALDKMIREEFGSSIELFLHVDYCEEFSCKICDLKNCAVRRHPKEAHVPWTIQNVLKNQKHRLGDGQKR